VTRKRLVITLAAGISAALLVVWVGNRTYWEDIKVPMPPRGEALVNPFYATQRFAAALGARATWDRMLTVPGPDAVIVISNWHWSLSRTRRAAIEQWVESGGRLVVDNTLIDPDGAFEEWSGIVREFPDTDTLIAYKPEEDPLCRRVEPEIDGRSSPPAGADTWWLCDLGVSWLETTRPPQWALREKKGLQAARTSIGRGSVTVINAAPFLHRALFNGDHGRVFVAAAGLRRGDEVHFLSESEYPSLLTLVWRYGAPVVTVGLTLIAALLWRGAARFGPLAPPAVAVRRSLVDQIRGTGRFALHYSDGQVLHAATLRAVDEAAVRRIGGYAALTRDERLGALARLTGVDRDALAKASYPGRRAAADLRRALAVLEAARRETLLTHTKVQHGTR
jgi:hypothetical protein